MAHAHTPHTLPGANRWPHAAPAAASSSWSIASTVTLFVTRPQTTSSLTDDDTPHPTPHPSVAFSNAPGSSPRPARATLGTSEHRHAASWGQQLRVHVRTCSFMSPMAPARSPTPPAARCAGEPLTPRCIIGCMPIAPILLGPPIIPAHRGALESCCMAHSTVVIRGGDEGPLRLTIAHAHHAHHAGAHAALHHHHGRSNPPAARHKFRAMPKTKDTCSSGAVARGLG